MGKSIDEGYERYAIDQGLVTKPVFPENKKYLAEKKGERKGMNLDDYQRMAMSTAIFPEDSKVVYPALGLVNEAGEYAGKVKKLIRGDNSFTTEAAGAELGDVLWYLAACANGLGLSLSTIAIQNLEKLADRRKRGKIAGDGDNR